jgi:hypothetical protein
MACPTLRVELFSPTVLADISEPHYSPPQSFRRNPLHNNPSGYQHVFE